ncbi:ROK family glucokinase [Texcoconibacillus texcoconensis]|uniref:Glucokinase n=1 Tax=Texcoconibacillus texcoconensis TaxID=1095777 RepID=A0A840QP52_9BACI|nr:ROK family glucokinase [Texcoconibacillus texcoconensis]MBB5173121.1 glucokinase [Texcoconibacillus texcoconensis]
MTKQWLAGIDVGGTTMKMAFFTEKGECVDKWEVPTNTEDEGIHIIDDIVDAIDEKLTKNNATRHDLIGVGLGAPGFIEVETGRIIEAVNVGWKDFPLTERLEAALEVPVAVDNDANIAALGERWLGAGDGAENVLFVTLGTGVGGGLISDRRIIHGESGFGGEIGHITAVTEGGAPCNCGKTGCLETISSATGIRRLGLEAVESGKTGMLSSTYEKEGDLTAKDVLDAAKAGDEAADEIVEYAMYHLGFALANLANAMNPNTIVIGGGVSKAGEFIIDRIRTHFQAYAIPKVGEDTNIRIATLGNDAGIVGGAWLASQRV